MHKSTWKAFERRVAALFGVRRQRLSGGSNRDDLSRSDSVHPRLFIECKARQRHSVIDLWWKVAPLARKEGKVPVVALHSTDHNGDFLLVRTDHLEQVARELKP